MDPDVSFNSTTPYVQFRLQLQKTVTLLIDLVDQDRQTGSFYATVGLLWLTQLLPQTTQLL